MDTALKRIRKTKGLMVVIAKSLDVSRQSVAQWKRVPTKYLRKVEKLTGIPRESLRPDLYR